MPYKAPTKPEILVYNYHNTCCGNLAAYGNSMIKVHTFDWDEWFDANSKFAYPYPHLKKDAMKAIAQEIVTVPPFFRQKLLAKLIRLTDKHQFFTQNSREKLNLEELELIIANHLKTYPWMEEKANSKKMHALVELQQQEYPSELEEFKDKIKLTLHLCSKVEVIDITDWSLKDPSQRTKAVLQLQAAAGNLQKLAKQTVPGILLNEKALNF